MQRNTDIGLFTKPSKKTANILSFTGTRPAGILSSILEDQYLKMVLDYPIIPIRVLTSVRPEIRYFGRVQGRRKF
ncbi:MAG: hypothetical protein SWH68_07805 [Thermodesulfobacteriota bacterium]|nr:hypothetical protein [Thermodesulfobacteriota bacterium]